MATEEDIAAIAGLRAAAAKHLTAAHGRGHWSSYPTEAAIRRGLRSDRVLVAREGTRIAGTVRVAAAKPWAIDPSYFTAVPRAVYLHDMAVDPASQRTGIGRRLIEEVLGVARAWPSEAIRLDAYDSEAGAGPFYARCGFREVGRVVYRKTPLIYFERLL
jgi:GNAT superfamily N-acetyltransferase